MSLQTWIIEPRDSLIVRDGKPFGANITHATSLDFPFPSTTTGGVRSRAGLDTNGIFDVLHISIVKDIQVRGSLLAEIHLNYDNIAEFYLPSPADCLILQNETQKLDKKADFFRLFPLKISGAITSLDSNLLSVGITQDISKSKPYSDLNFWYWRKLENWLLRGKDYFNQNLSDFGIEKLKKDSRTHVAINENLASKSNVDDEAGLFTTRGLEFNYGTGELVTTKKFALTIFIDDANSRILENKGDLAPLGGERRLVSWRKDTKQHSIINCPPAIKTQIETDKHCRLMLLTPAYFSEGMPKSNSNYEIKAIACNRYQTVSGWDFENDCPKPTRRLLPAGSVLFLDLQKNPDISGWIDNTWFDCIGDSLQAVKDGFGLCVLGTWDGSCLDKWE
jgi:CRISPR-associated protein Cmr3